MNKPSSNTLHLLLDQVIAIAKNAGKFIKNERLQFDYEKVEIKGLNDLVSYVDKTAEKQITDSLVQIFPLAGLF